jgi:hypothetical protein
MTGDDEVVVAVAVSARAANEIDDGDEIDDGMTKFLFSLFMYAGC